jgi:short-subunit dehydrogenase
MRRSLDGVRAVVTGASGGIGRAVTTKLIAAGAKVVAAARSADKLTALANERPGVIPAACDLTVPADRERLIRTAVEQLGGLDLLVNNAGVASWGHFATSTEAINRQVLETNFFAPAELIRLAVPHLTRGDRPCVVNVASLCGRRGLPAWPEHSASKAALVGLTEALRPELVRFGIDVLLVVPGLVKTDDLGRHLLRREGKAELDYANATPPDRVAGAVVRAIRSGRRETVVGKDARWLIRANRWMPRFVDRMIIRKVRKLYAS